MKIELKKVSINKTLSEETTCFTATVYIEGVLAGTANNRGNGGETSIHAANKFGLGLIKDAEAHCTTLPHDEFGPVSLEDVIDNLVEEEFKKKDQKALDARLKKDCTKGVCYGNAKTGYRMHFWKGMTIEQVLKHTQGRGALIKAISNIKAQLKEGETILNTNLGDLLK
jgi:hypothetical protein